MADSDDRGWGTSRPPSSRPVWARLTAGTRILLAYLALGVAVLLVTTIGTALQPVYGGLGPWLGVSVADLRAEPTAASWSTNLAAALAPGAQPQCLRFATVDVARDLVVVRAEPAWADGFSAETGCSSVPSGFTSRLALFDTATGAIRWVHDTGADLPSAAGVSIAWTSVFDEGSSVLVQAVTGSTSVVESLAISTGHVVGSTGRLAWSGDDRFTATGNVVALGRVTDDQLSYRYELRSADDLPRVIWTGPGNETATLIALSDRLLIGGDATEQVPLATGRATAWGPAVNTSLGYAVYDDTVYAVHTAGSGVTTVARHGFSALSKTGKVLWQSDLDLRGSYSLTRSCLAVTDRSGNRLTCLDYATGKPKWTVAVGAFSSAGSAAGQRSDDVFAVSAADEAHVVDLDGTTGHRKFVADVPTGSTIVAAGRTVVYALAYGFTGARSTLIAIDASSGRRLWTESSQLQFGIWGGNLVDVGADGFARRLADHS